MKILLLTIALTVMFPSHARAQSNSTPSLRGPRRAAEKVSMKMSSDQDTRWRLNDCLMRRHDFEVRDVKTIKLNSRDTCEVPEKLRASASTVELDLGVEIDPLREAITFTVILNRGGQGDDESYQNVLWCLCADADADDVFLSPSRNGSGEATRDPNYCHVILKGGAP